MNCLKNALYVISFVIFSYSIVRAEIATRTVTAFTEPFGYYIIKSFGLAAAGRIDIDYDVQLSAYNESEVNVLSWFQPSSYILILVLTEHEVDNWYNNLVNNDQNTVKDNIRTLCNSPSMLRRTVYGTGSFEYIPTKNNAQQFSIAVLQCETVYPQETVDVSVTVEIKNPRPYSSSYSQLPLEEVMVPRVVEGELIILFLMLAGLGGQMYLAGQCRLKIHWVFLVTLLAYIASLFAIYSDFFYYDNHGKELLNIEYTKNILYAFRDVTVITTLLLLSLGWSVCRRSLVGTEKRIVISSLFIFAVLHICQAVCIDKDEEICVSFSIMVFVIRCFLLLAIIIAMNFTVTQLRTLLSHTPWVPSTPVQYARCKQYQHFRGVFILYLLLPTAFYSIDVRMFTWKESWVVFTMEELLIIFMFLNIGTTFSPMHESQLMRAFDGTLNRAERVMDREE